METSYWDTAKNILGKKKLRVSFTGYKLLRMRKQLSLRLLQADASRQKMLSPVVAASTFSTMDQRPRTLSWGAAESPFYSQRQHADTSLTVSSALGDRRSYVLAGSGVSSYLFSGAPSEPSSTVRSGGSFPPNVLVELHKESVRLPGVGRRLFHEVTTMQAPPTLRAAQTEALSDFLRGTLHVVFSHEWISSAQGEYGIVHKS